MWECFIQNALPLIFFAPKCLGFFLGLLHEADWPHPACWRVSSYSTKASYKKHPVVNARKPHEQQGVFFKFMNYIKWKISPNYCTVSKTFSISA